MHHSGITTVCLMGAMVHLPRYCIHVPYCIAIIIRKINNKDASCRAHRENKYIILPQDPGEGSRKTRIRKATLTLMAAITTIMTTPLSNK